MSKTNISFTNISLTYIVLNGANLQRLRCFDSFVLATEDGNANVGRQEKIFLRNPRILLSISLVWLPYVFYFRWNSVDSSISWTKRWTVVLEVSATFWRQRGNGAVEVSFESRTAHIHVPFLCSVISIIVLPTLPSPSSAVLLVWGPYQEDDNMV